MAITVVWVFIDKKATLFDQCLDHKMHLRAWSLLDHKMHLTGMVASARTARVMVDKRSLSTITEITVAVSK